MSVKTMTNEQLQNDLKNLEQMWPSGIPPEQIDRFNSLKSELKRRGSVVDVRQPPSDVSHVSVRSDDQISKEMAVLMERLAEDPADEEAQARFADLRFEVRQRGKLNSSLYHATTSDAGKLDILASEMKAAHRQAIEAVSTSTANPSHVEYEDGELEIQRKFSFIHALARQLLHVNDTDAQNLFVGVQPLGNGWQVQVSFSGFRLAIKASDLSGALEDALQHLTNAVSQSLEEGYRLLESRS